MHSVTACDLRTHQKDVIITVIREERERERKREKEREREFIETNRKHDDTCTK